MVVVLQDAKRQLWCKLIPGAALKKSLIRAVARAHALVCFVLELCTDQFCLWVQNIEVVLPPFPLFQASLDWRHLHADMVISDKQVQEQAFAFVTALRVSALLTSAFVELVHAVSTLSQSRIPFAVTILVHVA